MVKLIKNHRQSHADERGFAFLPLRTNEDPKVCGRQEVRQILIGNYVRKLHAFLFFLDPPSGEWSLGWVCIHSSLVYSVVITIV